MRKDVKTRLRKRVQARLEELGMTARELAQAVDHGDAWISGVLKGAQGIDWDDFDAIADKLGLPPSELVRYDDSELRELLPSEMRLLQHYRDWPQGMRDRWLAMLDHFASTVPDEQTGELLERLRALPNNLRRPVLAWLFRLLEETPPLEALTGGVVLGSNEVSTEPDTTRPTLSVRTKAGARALHVGRRVPHPLAKPSQRGR